MQIKAAPATEGLHAVYSSLTSLGSVRAHASASLVPAAATCMADSAHARTASAQPSGCMSSDVPDRIAGICLPPGQVPSWRQRISQPLYPEKLLAAGQSQDSASSTSDLAHAAAHKQGGTPRNSAPSCPHCSASHGDVVSSEDSRAAVKGKAWSAELYKGLSGVVQCQSAAMPKAHVLGTVSEAPRNSAALPDTAQRRAQQAKRPESAALRGKNTYRRPPVENSHRSALGKENNKQCADEQTQPKQVPDGLQRRGFQPRSAPLARVVKDESPRYGAALSAHASTPSTPRLGVRGALTIHAHSSEVSCQTC